MLKRDQLFESAQVEYLAAERRDAEVARLDKPWVADEGPLDCAFRRSIDKLRLRGLAFDRDTTVFWDEDAVTVVRRAAPEAGILPIPHEVAVRERFQGVPRRLQRIDYFAGSTLIGSRYQVEEAHDA
jgi:hypothetical protein